MMKKEKTSTSEKTSPKLHEFFVSDYGVKIMARTAEESVEIAKKQFKK